MQKLIRVPDEVRENLSAQKLVRIRYIVQSSLTGNKKMSQRDVKTSKPLPELNCSFFLLSHMGEMQSTATTRSVFVANTHGHAVCRDNQRGVRDGG